MSYLHMIVCRKFDLQCNERIQNICLHLRLIKCLIYKDRIFKMKDLHNEILSNVDLQCNA